MLYLEGHSHVYMTWSGLGLFLCVGKSDSSEIPFPQPFTLTIRYQQTTSLTGRLMFKLIYSRHAL